jgi:predicted dienelactone hydrolase
MRLQPATIALVSGLLAGTFVCAAAQESLSQPESNSGSAPQFTTPQLPLPTGQFGVGRVGYQWTDGSRPDGHAADPNAHRDLMVYLWYPAPKASGGEPAEYIPGAKRMDRDTAAAPAMRDEFEGIWPLIISGTISSLAFDSAPVARSRKKFPVVILAHGAGGTTFEYASLIASLVSRGYVVAAIENTYGAPAVSFPDGRIVAAYHEADPPNLSPDQRFQRMMKSAGQAIDTGARDIVFVLNQLIKLDTGNEKTFVLRNRLDLNRVASMGHSAGGANATLACQMDARFKACVSLDGQMPPVAAFPESPDGKWFTQPVLLLEVDHTGGRMGFNATQNDVFLKKKDDQLSRCPAGSYDVVLKSPGLVHGSFSDYPLLAAMGRQTETKDALHNLKLIASYIEAFLDQTLNQVNSQLLETEGNHPEAIVKQYGQSSR